MREITMPSLEGRVENPCGPISNFLTVNFRFLLGGKCNLPGAGCRPRRSPRLRGQDACIVRKLRNMRAGRRLKFKLVSYIFHSNIQVIRDLFMIMIGRSRSLNP